MRDPDGSLSFEKDTAIRHLHAPLAEGHFLRSALAARWAAAGTLVPFTLAGTRTVLARRMAFVSHPSEWSDCQLEAAARLTLNLQAEAVAEGFDLKDASAWNIVFEGTRPVFCDLLSFVPLTQRKWWAAGQYARHFLLPLALAQRGGLHGHQTFKVWRDGIPAAAARGLFGRTRFFTRFWPLMAEGKAGDEVKAGIGSGNAANRDAIASFRAGLQASLSFMLAGAAPQPPVANSSAPGWLAYETQREHYAQESMNAKRCCVGEWLQRLQPDWVADFGCNTGEFARLALAQGASVVAVDADHDAMDHMFRTESPSAKLYPLVAELDDLSGGRGWGGNEFPGLPSRFERRFDLVMMLALIHHLAVGASVPLHAVAAFAAHCTRQWLIVELLESTDPQLQLLCAQRGRLVDDFGIERQRAAFLAAGFVVDAECSLAPAARRLLLLRRSA